MNQAPPTAAPPVVPEHNRVMALLGIGLSVFMGTMDLSIVNISLPTLMAELGVGLAVIEWVVVSYALVITSLMLGAARLGDMYGKKRIYLWGIVIFGVGSALCGMAPGAYSLIVFRGLQALGTVMMQALGMAIVTEMSPPEQRGRVLGVMGTAVSLGLAVGPPLGGMLIATVGWRFIFLVNLPVCLLAWFMVTRYVPAGWRGPGGERFDSAGALVLFLALICYALGMTLGQHHGFDHGASPALLLASLAGVGLFIWVEHHSTSPMMPLGLFKAPEFSLGLVMGWIAFLILGGVFVLPIYLEVAEGYTPLQVGFFMLVVPVTMGISSPVAGWCADRFGHRPVSLVGLVLLVGGCLALSGLRLHLSPLEYVLRVSPVGLGLGLFQAPNNSAILGHAPKERLGMASGLVSLSRTLGNTSGVPLMGAVFSMYFLAAAPLADQSNLMSAPPEALVAGVAGAYQVAAWLGTSSIVVAVVAWWLESRNKARAKAGLR
ncbi:MAG: MFS transporter [Desulfarculaceae bacterium]|nr:MFS transporter [Desulfarculaceae bacterium]MCF8074408.1 MFS transporter [Desulfarculaceae bacterium]MCF8103616.1 MFS transporter [Desulfarculaceae bacterium]MCF8116029.1 MFS transporter [Desulfarculaceae bacterium]